jgi:hypothetical protein
MLSSARLARGTLGELFTERGVCDGAGNGSTMPGLVSMTTTP